jgi:cell division protein ZapA
MREIRDTGKIIGTDRIAVMAALNISHELLTQHENSSDSHDISFTHRIRSLQEKIDDALHRSREIDT